MDDRTFNEEAGNKMPVRKKADFKGFFEASTNETGLFLCFVRLVV